MHRASNFLLRCIQPDTHAQGIDSPEQKRERHGPAQNRVIDNHMIHRSEDERTHRYTCSD
jgi:hypothetical protein